MFLCLILITPPPKEIESLNPAGFYKNGDSQEALPVVISLFNLTLSFTNHESLPKISISYIGY